jgi:hypothetical protein
MTGAKARRRSRLSWLPATSLAPQMTPFQWTYQWLRSCFQWGDATMVPWLEKPGKSWAFQPPSWEPTSWEATGIIRNRHPIFVFAIFHLRCIPWNQRPFLKNRWNLRKPSAGDVSRQHCSGEARSYSCFGGRSRVSPTLRRWPPFCKAVIGSDGVGPDDFWLCSLNDWKKCKRATWLLGHNWIWLQGKSIVV